MLFFILLLIWKIFDFFISIISPKLIPYLGFFSYGPTMDRYGMPHFIQSLTNFDGIFYIRIATLGYHQTEQAYFPLYPITISLLNHITKNPIIAGVLISHISFFIAFYLFNKYLKTLLTNHQSNLGLLFLILYPTSYYFGVMYTESLFFLLFITSIYGIKTKHFFISFLSAYFASLTRVVGVFIIFPIAAQLIQKIINEKPKKYQEILSILLRNWQHTLVLLAPLIGLATYSIYLKRSVGDAIYFFHAQESFGANRSSHLITPIQVIYRYIKIFITSDVNFQYVIAIGELFFYLFAITLLTYDLIILLRKKINYERIGLNIFSWICVIIPSLTGTLTAMPRYTLLSISLFLVLAEMKSKPLKITWGVASIILHTIMFAYFIQGYYVT